MISFIKTPDGDNPYERAEVIYKIIKEELTLHELLDEFSYFLKCLGYHFDNIIADRDGEPIKDKDSLYDN